MCVAPFTQGKLKDEYHNIREAVADVNGSVSGSVGGMFGKDNNDNSGSLGSGSYTNMGTLSQSMSTTGACVLTPSPSLGSRRAASRKRQQKSTWMGGVFLNAHASFLYLILMAADFHFSHAAVHLLCLITGKCV